MLDEIGWPEEWTIAANDSPLYVTAEVPPMMPTPPTHCHFARSTDGGLSWRDTSTFGHDVLSGVMVLPSGRVIMAHTGYRPSIIDFSTNGGVSWDSKAGIGLPDGAYAFNIHSIKSFLIMCAASDTSAFLYKSTDNGESWVCLDTGLLANSYLDVLSVGNSILAKAYFYNGDYYVAIVSTDEGLTWTVNPNPSIGLLKIWTDGKSLFASPENSAVEVAGIGEPWRSWADGLPTEGGPIQQLVFSDEFAFALLRLPEPFRQGVWRRPLTELITGIDPHDRSANAREFQLLQNYPNPFNPSTTIRYGVPRRSHVSLTVFNVLGRQVAQLVNGEMDAGNHELHFTAANLASGVYFYRLQAGEFVQAKSLIVSR